MSKRVSDFLDASFKVMLAEFERDRSIPHHGTKGAVREHVVIKFLKGILPSRFGISPGLIISADDEWSPQQDAIIFDRLGSPLVSELGAAGKLVFVESVLATLEIKSILDSNPLLDQMHLNADRVGSMKRKIIPTSLAPGIAIERRSPAIFSCCLAFETSLLLDTIRSNFRKAYETNSGLNMLCVLKDKAGESGIFLSAPSQHFYCPEQGEAQETHLPVLRRFTFELLCHLQRCGPFYPAPDLEAYTGVYDLGRMQELLTRFYKESLSSEEILEMVLRSLEVMPGIHRDDDVFMFAGPKIGGDQIQVRVWTYESASEGKKPIYVGQVREAIKRRVKGQDPEEDDGDLLGSLVSWYRIMKKEDQKLLIKQL